MTPRGTVLVVDDDAAVGEIVGSLLEQEGFEAEWAASGEVALSRVERRHFDLVVSDLRMPGIDGLRLLEALSQSHPDLPVVMLTAHGTIPLAVEAMRAGAAEFVLKPFDRQELLYVVCKLVEAARLRAAAGPPARPAANAMLGASPALDEVRRTIARAAASRATVLIRGESGTGKELVARAVHEQSPRRAAPLIKLTCAALPEGLLESELFGYEKGAFTGAAAQKPGRVELAQGGTLFLDEVGDISPGLQVKLLRLLQDRQFERVGGTRTIYADVRFVAATHRDLELMMGDGRFREDLFWRLNVIPIVLPALRTRGHVDIRLLAGSFCAEIGRENGRVDAHIEPDALELLCAEPWPGNIRQLQNFVERLVILSDGPAITAEQVRRELGNPAMITSSASAGSADAAGSGPQDRSQSLQAARTAAEREALLEALRRAGENRTKAARLLNISRRSLHYKLKQHGLGE
jgi:two-component system, NtrC family, response regulator AtoC